jgi:hypothetical protein
MAKDEYPGAGPADRRVEVETFAGHLRETADRLTEGWTPPATMSTTQLRTVLADLGARRAQVQALRAQLGAFDEQLATLEASLRPVYEWARVWADLEQTAGLWGLPRSRRPGP